MVVVAEWSNALGCGPSNRKVFVGSNPISYPKYGVRIITVSKLDCESRECQFDSGRTPKMM